MHLHGTCHFYTIGQGFAARRVWTHCFVYDRKVLHDKTYLIRHTSYMNGLLQKQSHSIEGTRA